MSPHHIDVEVKAVTDTSAITVPEPLTLLGIGTRRSAAGRLVAGVAANADVELFKGHIHHQHKNKAKRWDHRLTKESAGRKSNKLKDLAKLLKSPGLISLGGGLPSSEYFPFDELILKVPADGLYSGQEMHDKGVILKAGKHDLEEGRSLFDITTAFNYGQGTGSAQLLRYIVEHTELVHNPPYQDWQCTMSVGSTSALDVALRMLLNPGQYVITEEYSFSAAVESVRALGGKLASVPLDSDGMIPEALDSMLSEWNPEVRGASKPFILYTVPTGQNPTGATMPIERRKQIYAVAQKHDLYILEDEPYYYLQMPSHTNPVARSTSDEPFDSNAFLKSLVPSLLSLDTDGRVMRMDSFSKVIAPGTRVGWITASAQIVDRYIRHSDLSTQGPSGISQLVLFKLLDDHWGHQGYLQWLAHLRSGYTERRNVMLAACETHLPKEIISWNITRAGMFQWLKVDWKKHPHYVGGQKGPGEIEEELFQTSIAKGALILKGSLFHADEDEIHQNMFFRATFAAAPFHKIDEAIRRFGEAVGEVFQLV